MSGVTVSMKMTAKQSGALYMRNIALEKRIEELESSRQDLIEEFAEAECMGDLAKIARDYGYQR